MGRTWSRCAFIAWVTGAVIGVAGPACASIIAQFEFMGTVTQGADVVAPGTDISALLRFETLQVPLRVDVGPDLGSSTAITSTVSFSSLEVFFDGERFGRNDGGEIIEFDGNGRVPDRYTVQGTPMTGGGPWMTDVIIYSSLDDSAIDIPLPNLTRAAGMSLGPYMTDTLAFQGQVGEFALGFMDGRVLRGQINQVLAGPLSAISEPMSLLLSAAGLAGLGAMAGWKRRRRG